MGAASFSTRRTCSSHVPATTSPYSAWPSVGFGPVRAGPFFFVVTALGLLGLVGVEEMQGDAGALVVGVVCAGGVGRAVGEKHDAASRQLDGYGLVFGG
jgi:hypothetical protein